MSEPPPKIDFPCDYPIKVIMLADRERTQLPVEQQVDAVLEAVHSHAQPVDRQTLQLNPSRQGNYVSVSLDIIATGENQLRLLHAELRALPYVKLVL